MTMMMMITTDRGRGVCVRLHGHLDGRLAPQSLYTILRWPVSQSRPSQNIVLRTYFVKDEIWPGTNTYLVYAICTRSQYTQFPTSAILQCPWSDFPSQFFNSNQSRSSNPDLIIILRLFDCFCRNFVATGLQSLGRPASPERRPGMTLFLLLQIQSWFIRGALVPQIRSFF